MYCKNCGNKLDDDSKFCEKCGQTISKKEENNNTTSKNTKKSGIELEKEKLEKINKKLKIPYLIIEFVIILLVIFVFMFLFIGTKAMDIIIQTSLISGVIIEILFIIGKLLNKYMTNKRINREKPLAVYTIIYTIIMCIGIIFSCIYIMDNVRAGMVKVDISDFNITKKSEYLYYKTKNGDTYVKISADGTKLLQVYSKENNGKYESSELLVDLINTGHSKVSGSIIPTLEERFKSNLEKIAESEYNKIVK